MKTTIRFVTSLIFFALGGISVQAAGTNYWAPTSCVIGGVGTWDTTASQWSPNSTGGGCVAWVNANTDSAVFDGTASYAVANTGTKTVNKIFRTIASALTISSSGTLAFRGTSPGVDVPAATTVTLSCPFSGTMTKSGAGRCDLNNSGQSAKIIFAAGMCTIAAENRLGSATGSDFWAFDGGGVGHAAATSAGSIVYLSSAQGVTVKAGGAFFGASSGANQWVIASAILDGTAGVGPGGLSAANGAPFYSPYNAGCVLVLSNVTGTLNSYLGATTISTLSNLRLGSSNQIPDGSVVNVTGTFNMNGFSDTVNTLSLLASGATTSGSGSTLTVTNAIDLRAGTVSVILGGVAAVTKTTGGSVDMTAANTYSGGTTISAGTVRINSNTGLGAANSSVTLANGTTLSTSGGTARTLTYKWTVTGDITLGQGTTGTGTLTLAGASGMNLGGATRVLTIANPTDTISAVITNGGLTIDGGGTLTLSGANSYTGPTTVNAGVLNVTGANNCPGDMTVNVATLSTTTASTGGGSYTLADGATMNLAMTSASASLNVSNQTYGASIMNFDFAHFGYPTSRAINNIGDLAVNGAVTVNVKGFDTNGTTTLIEYAGARSGAGVFTLGAVPPRVIASIDETITNKVILNTTASDTLVWVGDPNNNWDINSGNMIWKLVGTMGLTDYQENTVQGDTVRFDDTAPGTAMVNMTVPLSPFTVTVDNSVTNYSFIGAGKISGSGNLIKSGSAELTITNANDFTGGTTLNAGTLNIGNNAALGTGRLTMNGGLIRSDSATARTLSVPTDLNGNVTLGDAVNIGDITLSGASTIKGASRQVTVDTINATMSGAIGQDVAGRGLTKAGAGVLNLSGANTFTGGFDHNAGTVRVNNNAALGAANSTVNLANGIVLSTTTTTVRTLTYAFNVNGDFTLGQAAGGTAALTLAGSMNLGGVNRTINVVTPVATNTAISAVITNGGLTKIGTGTLVLSGNNLYTGDTTNADGFISLNTTVSTPFGSGGTLYLNGGGISTTGNRDTLPVQNPVVMLTNAVFEGDTTGSGFRHFPINGLVTAVDGTLTLKNTNTVAGIWNTRLHAGGMNFMRPIIIGASGDPGGVQLSSYNTNGAGDQTFSGQISGYGTFSRGASISGTGGKTFLTASNTYSGGTIISDGTLLINNTTGSGTGSGAVTVTNGGTLGGTGTIAGAVAVTNGNIAAGASVGTLTLTNGLNLSAGGTNVWELGANSTNNPGVDFDQLVISGGNLALGGTSRLLVKFIGSATVPSIGDSFWQHTNTWKIIARTGTATNAGSSVFSTVIATGGSAGHFTTSADNAGNVFLTFIPEAVTQPVFNKTIGSAGTTNTQISWSSQAGFAYQVEYKNDLNDTQWLTLTNITATGTTTTIVDATSPVPAKRFYRILVP